jgi:hypothetical protein
VHRSRADQDTGAASSIPRWKHPIQPVGPVPFVAEPLVYAFAAMMRKPVMIPGSMAMTVSAWFTHG